MLSIHVESLAAAAYVPISTEQGHLHNVQRAQNMQIKSQYRIPQPCCSLQHETVIKSKSADTSSPDTEYYIYLGIHSDQHTPICQSQIQ